MAGLRGERLWRIPCWAWRGPRSPQAFLKGEYGRLRTVLAAGGDKLWLVTSETDCARDAGEGATTGSWR